MKDITQVNFEDYHDVSLNALLVKACTDFKSKKSALIKNVRTDSHIVNLRDYVMVGNPRLRWLSLKGRNNSITAQIVEMLMVISGECRLKYLSPFLPRAEEYSDDGIIWRANYGTRIRGNNPNGRYNDDLEILTHDDLQRFTDDQLQRVIDTLSKDGTTRQAFISVSDGHVDFIKHTKDTPCTMTLVFDTLDGRVNLSTFMRSNDAIFGFSGVNYLIFTTMQELVANILGLELGSYTHHAVSFHVYEAKYDVINKLHTNYIKDKMAFEDISLGTLFKGVRSLKEFEEYADLVFKYIDKFLVGETLDREEILTDFDGEKFESRELRLLLLLPIWRMIAHQEPAFSREGIVNSSMYVDSQVAHLFKNDKFIDKPLNVNF